MTAVALATCAEFPRLHDDDRLLVEPLAARGVTAVPARWDDPEVEWSSFGLTAIRNTWDYAPRRDEFLTWARQVPRLANPAEVVAWNTDKRYLRELADAGLPVVPTTWISPGDDLALPDDGGEYVLKPAVSAGSVDTGRYDLGDTEQRRLAGEHAVRLVDAGATVMVQPYLDAVDIVGETALLYFGGAFSHAITKAALLSGPYTGVDGLFLTEQITATVASTPQRDVAEAVLAATPGGADQLLYARVDLIPSADGTPTLLEYELTEPSVFLEHADGAADRFADAIVAHLG